MKDFFSIEASEVSLCDHLAPLLLGGEVEHHGRER
jgi:hypothetical protein